ncbi:glycoside hydrolase family 31 protein [Melioribacteraceae bacterium 4301-Me]|uniref:glycoside hydrolase family 31 protein n=1 Tax=Pyranulibacter aquaticus TaxID=3163344 RepID=UPI003597EB9A
MVKYSIIIPMFLCFSTLYAGFTFVGKIKNYNVFPNKVEFTLTNANLIIYVVDQNILRFRYTNQGEFSNAPSYAVIFQQPEKVNFLFNEESDKFVIKTTELIVQIKKDPCRISIFDNKMNLLNKDDEYYGVSFDNDEVRCFKKLFDGEKFYGLGEKSDQLLKNGNQYTMWNSDFPAYNSKRDPLYVSIPFFIGIRNYRAYGIFFDNTYKSYFNMGASNKEFYWFGADKGEMDYYFIYGPQIKRVITSYTMLTGKIELPPLWSLGYQQSRWSYYPETTVRRIAQSFRDYEIPCDAIYLDIDYMDGYRVFTWDKEKFPNPTKMINDLKAKGFKLITIIDPGVKADTEYFAAKEGVENDLFVKYPNGKFYEGQVWPSWSYFPDFTYDKTINWWGDKLSILLKDGIEGFWNDMNEPAVWGQAFPDIVQFSDNGFGADHKKIHNVYALQMAKATREGVRKYSPNKRHFILTRAGFSGIQRYSAVWTGDSESNEEHLKLACIMPQNLGLSGVPFIGTDVGGFIGEPTARLYVRWMQLGSFTPFFRAHSEFNSRAKEPFAFDPNTRSLVRDIIRFRYQLLPYLYNEFYNASVTGLPIMKPMFLNYQNDENCYSYDSQLQFMLGDNLLIAPVLSSTDNFKKLYLPGGKWYSFNENKTYDGSNWIIVNAPIEQIPIFIRQGGFVPMQDVQNFVGEKKIDELQVLLFPSPKSEYQLYQDDGISYDYTSGKYSITKFSEELSNNKLKIHITTEHDGYNTGLKNYLFKILAVSAPKAVYVNNERISDNKKNDYKTNNQFNFDKEKSILNIKTNYSKKLEIQIEF